MSKVRVRFAGREVEFVDRETALRQLDELAERGTWRPLVVYGPEGCGKTALLRQARAVLEDRGYHVVYVDPLAREADHVLQYTPSIRDVVRRVLASIPEPYSRIVDVAIGIAREAVRRLRRPDVAVLMDDVFQAVGVDKAEMYVKALLNLIEHPPGSYGKIVVIVTSSEGVTRARIGRHDWATFRILWNMPRDGFTQLYDLLPSPKPSLDEAWRWTGGNPRALERLYGAGWDVEGAIDDIAKLRNLKVWAVSGEERDVLLEVLEDPDTMFRRAHEEAVRKMRDQLIEKNLIIEIWDRDRRSWMDVPPPERDVELGIGRYYAWQTPLHREAVRRALGTVRG